MVFARILHFILLVNFYFENAFKSFQSIPMFIFRFVFFMPPKSIFIVTAIIILKICYITIMKLIFHLSWHWHFMLPFAGLYSVNIIFFEVMQKMKLYDC